MLLNEIDIMWEAFDKEVEIYENDLERRFKLNTNLSDDEINEKIRNSVNRKFKKKNNDLIHLKYNQMFAETVSENIILLQSGEVNISLPRNDNNITILKSVLEGMLEKNKQKNKDE